MQLHIGTPNAEGDTHYNANVLNDPTLQDRIQLPPHLHAAVREIYELMEQRGFKDWCYGPIASRSLVDKPSLNDLHSKLSALFPSKNVSVDQRIMGRTPKFTTIGFKVSIFDGDDWKCIALEPTLPELWRAVARYHAAHPQEHAVDVLTVAASMEGKA